MDAHITAQSDVDPIKAYITIRLKRPIAKETRAPLRAYLREWAKTMDCDVTRVTIEKHAAVATVLTKRRNWNRDQYGKFTGRWSR